MGVNKVVYGGNTLIDLSADTVAANKMLAGITGHDKAGNPITGNIPSQAAQTITPGTTDKTIAAGKYLSGEQTIKGDANLVAGNIKSGVSIFGVAGSYEGGEDVSAETAEYTSLLTDLETAIDALPDAGSGGGSAVETCTVTVNFTGGAAGYGESGLCDIYYANGTEAASITATADSTAIDALKGSLLVITLDDGINILGSCTTNTINLVLNDQTVLVFYVPDSGTITIG